MRPSTTYMFLNFFRYTLNPQALPFLGKRTNARCQQMNLTSPVQALQLDKAAGITTFLSLTTSTLVNSHQTVEHTQSSAFCLLTHTHFQEKTQHTCERSSPLSLHPNGESRIILIYTTEGAAAMDPTVIYSVCHHLQVHISAIP